MLVSFHTDNVLIVSAVLVSTALEQLSTQLRSDESGSRRKRDVLLSLATKVTCEEGESRILQRGWMKLP